jgi:AhpD family alkylhydroperoxidase
MPRLPDVAEDSPDLDVELLRSIRERRGGTLLELDRQLLHSAPLARGWNALLGAVRGQTMLDAATRELVILLVAVLNRAPYERAQHTPPALAAGLSQAKIDALPAWRRSALFDERQRDLLAYAETMTLQVQVPQPLFDAARRHFGSDREMVELTATVAAYNMVSRFLEALHIGQ